MSSSQNIQHKTLTKQLCSTLKWQGETASQVCSVQVLCTVTLEIIVRFVQSDWIRLGKYTDLGLGIGQDLAPLNL